MKFRFLIPFLFGPVSQAQSALPVPTKWEINSILLSVGSDTFGSGTTVTLYGEL